METKTRITLAIGVLNAFDIAKEAIRFAVDGMTKPEEAQLVVFDNGSDDDFFSFLGDYATTLDKYLGGGLKVIRSEKNIGNYPLFFKDREEIKGDVVAFIHSDVFVYEKGWDERVVSVFDGIPEVGLAGFIGSTQIDNFGGRGSGTVSNMKGYSVSHDGKTWTGSKAEVHGRRDEGLIVDGAVVDGCVMIFRREFLFGLTKLENMPLHHHYDRLFSCQALEQGLKVAIIGVGFDHISGQTANTQSKWQDASREWFREHLGIESPSEWAKINASWVARTDNPSRGKVPDQWDYASYLEAERLFLTEYRDQKHIVPVTK